MTIDPRVTQLLNDNKLHYNDYLWIKRLEFDAQYSAAYKCAYGKPIVMVVDTTIRVDMAQNRLGRHGYA